MLKAYMIVAIVFLFVGMYIWGALFLFLVIIGSVGFAYALRQQRADRFKQALPSFVVAVCRWKLTCHNTACQF